MRRSTENRPRPRVPARFVTAADTAVVTDAYIGLVDKKGFDIALDHAFDPIDGRRRQCTIDTDITVKRRVFDS